jgi:hypothetical protein
VGGGVRLARADAVDLVRQIPALRERTPKAPTPGLRQAYLVLLGGDLLQAPAAGELALVPVLKVRWRPMIGLRGLQSLRLPGSAGG